MIDIYTVQGPAPSLQQINLSS